MEGKKKWRCDAADVTSPFQCSSGCRYEYSTVVVRYGVVGVVCVMPTKSQKVCAEYAVQYCTVHMNSRKLLFTSENILLLKFFKTTLLDFFRKP